MAEQYLAVCAHNEHFMDYRDIVRLQIENQLAAYGRGQELARQALIDRPRIEIAAVTSP